MPFMHVHQPGLPARLAFLPGHVVFIRFDEQVANSALGLLAWALLLRKAYLAHGFHHRLSRYMPRFGLTPSPGLPIRHFHSPFCQLRPQQRIDPLMRTQSHHLVGQVTVSAALPVLEVGPLVTNHTKRRQKLLVVIPTGNDPTFAFLSFLAQPLVGTFDHAPTHITTQLIQPLFESSLKFAVRPFPISQLRDQFHHLQEGLPRLLTQRLQGDLSSRVLRYSSLSGTVR